MLGHRFIWFKFGAVVLSVLGIVVISVFRDINAHLESQRKDVFLGYSAAVISSLFAALYEILYCKFIVPKRPSAVFSLFITGCIGLCTLFLGLFLFPLFHYTGFEIIEMPPPDSLVYILLLSILGIAFNSLFLLAIMFSGAVLAATGVLVSIPLTYLADFILFGTNVALNVWIGSCLIFLGYFLLQMIQLKDVKQVEGLDQERDNIDNDDDEEASNLLA